MAAMIDGAVFDLITGPSVVPGEKKTPALNGKKSVCLWFCVIN